MERHTEVCMQSRTYLRYADFRKRHSCTEKRQLGHRHKEPHNWWNTEAHTGYAHTKEKKKTNQTMWKSVVALRIHLACRPPKAGTRISLQENMYVETDAQLTLKVIYKLLWTHAACSGAGTLT